jgi:hypothetical protein
VLQWAPKARGIPKPATCHTFRPSFATRPLEDGHDIRTVPKLLGHRDVGTTMISTNVLNRRLAGVTSLPTTWSCHAPNPRRYWRRPDHDTPRRLAAYPGPGAAACTETLWGPWRGDTDLRYRIASPSYAVGATLPPSHRHRHRVSSRY